MSLNIWTEQYETEPKLKVTFEGSQFAVGLSNLDGAGNVLVNLLSEDDEMWYVKAQFSAYWLEDLLRQLGEAKDYLEKNCKRDQYGGYKFKRSKP